MNHRRTTSKWIAAIVVFVFLSTLHANTQPKFVLTPTTATTVNVLANATATVTYTVTNKTKITRTLTIKPIAGITQTTSGAGVCSNPFVLAQNQSCSLTLQINGSQIPEHLTGGPEVCKTMGNGDNTYDPFLCSQPSQIDSLNITRIALASISVQPTELSIEAGGLTGTMTVKNNSTTVTATNIAANFSGTLLDGHVTQDATNCQTVKPAQSCTLTFTSRDVGVPLTSFPIQGDNTTQITASMVIVFPTVATITVTGSPLYLLASSTPATEYLTVHNTNTLLTADRVAAVLTGNLLTQVIQDPDECNSLPPLGYCNLAFTPVASGTAVPLAVVNILGTNTTTAQAQIAVNSVSLVPITVTAGSPAVLVADGISNKTMTIRNDSTTDLATNVQAYFDGTALYNNVTQTRTGCDSIPIGETCEIKFTAKTTQVPATPFTIQGSNTATASPTPVIIIGPPTAPLRIEPNPAVLSLETNGVAKSFNIYNLSLQVTAQNIAPTLSTLMASSVTVINECSPTLAPNSSCIMTFTPLGTAVSLESFPIEGTNTTQLGGAIQILSTSPTEAQIQVEGNSQLVLDPLSTGTITIKNVSAGTITASQISAAIFGTALDSAGVTQDAGNCVTLDQGNTCNLSFTAATTQVTPPVTVNIFGSNTSVTTAQISVNGTPSLTINPTSYSLLADNTSTQTMYVTNTSSTTDAQNVTAHFSGGLSGQVTIVDNTCGTVPKGGECQITFKAGSNIVPEETFSVYGDNTSVTQGTMSIGSYFAYVSSNDYIYRCQMNSITGLFSNCLAQTVLDLAGEPTALAVDPTGKYLYAAKSNSGIWKCSIASDGTLKSDCVVYRTGLPYGDYSALTLLPTTGQYIYAISRTDQGTQRCTIDLASGEIVPNSCLEDSIYGAYGLAFNSDGTRIYMTSTGGTLDIYICPVTNGDIGTCTPDGFSVVTTGICLTHNNQYAYVGLQSSSTNTIRFLVNTDGTVSNDLYYPTGIEQCQVAVNSTDTYVYFTNANSPGVVRVCPIENSGALGTCQNASSQTFGSCRGLALWEHAVPNS